MKSKSTRKAPTAAQKQAAAEKRERIGKLWEQIAAMPQEKRDELVNQIGAIVNAEGRPLSPSNTMLLFMQLGTVSVVGGFRQWLNAGRAVRKGEKGLSIWVPKTYGGDESAAPEGALCLPAPGQSTCTDSPAIEGKDGNRSRFVLGTVFDISQTDPVEAPTTETPALEPQQEAFALLG